MTGNYAQQKCDECFRTRSAESTKFKVDLAGIRCSVISFFHKYQCITTKPLG